MAFGKYTREEAIAKLKERQEKARNKPRKAKTAPKLGLKRGSMVKPIPLKMREELAEDTFMQTCCLKSTDCQGRVQWHHNLIYAGKRINEKGAILPVCEWHHEKESKFKKDLDFMMELRMTDEDKSKYPRRKWL